MKTGYVYKITSPSGKIYIGSTNNLKKRINFYKNLNCKRQPKLYNSLNKYRFENHTVEIIETCEISILHNREHYWGMIYDVLSNKGLNLALPASNSKYPVMTEECRKKLSSANKGKKLSKETRLKISISNKGKKRVFSLEHRKRISEGKKGTKYSDEHRARMSESQKLRRFNETIKSKSSKIVLDMSTGVYYETLNEASLAMNLTKRYLSKMLTGARRNKTTLKYV